MRHIGKKLIPQPVLCTARDNVFLMRQDEPPLSADAAGVLHELFESDVRRLEELLGRSVPGLRRFWYREQGAAQA